MKAISLCKESLVSLLELKTRLSERCLRIEKRSIPDQNVKIATIASMPTWTFRRSHSHTLKRSVVFGIPAFSAFL